MAHITLRPVALFAVCIALVAALVSCAGGRGSSDAPPPGINVSKRVKTDLGEDVVAVLLNAEPLMLCSMHPNPKGREDWAQLGINGNETIHDYAVLGKHALTPMEKGEILNAFFRGMDNDDGKRAACFNPRHALVGEYQGKKVEIVICFECFSFNLYVDGKHISSTLGATDSPARVFNAMLKKHGVKMPAK